MRQCGRVIFHIDANSAYLSWTAADLVNRGCSQDLRKVPSVIAGDPDNRHGIILAKSIPAKRCGIVTGESLLEARRKCPKLLIYHPDYELYMDCSQAMYDILLEYSPAVQRYSIDECFLDYTGMMAGKTDGGVEATALSAAEEIKERIHRELGFTVNVGIGPNKLLAKMAGELRKPDAVETMWAKEVPQKLWPLPVRELFMVGSATERKLRAVNIVTIGDLAKADPLYLKAALKSHGELIHRYANGIDHEPVTADEDIFRKGVGNSITMKYDMTDKKEIAQVLLALCERVSQRLRRLERAASLISVAVKDDGFLHYSHQAQLPHAMESTSELYHGARRLFFDCWKGEPIRQLGVSVSQLTSAKQQQLSLFQNDGEKERSADAAVDLIREKYGNEAVMRGVFANTGVAPMQGGVHEGRYIMMGGYEH